MGYILHATGMTIYDYYNGGFVLLDNNINIMFSGSFLACLFWVNCT